MILFLGFVIGLCTGIFFMMLLSVNIIAEKDSELKYLKNRIKNL
jgi:uncharacterized protein involved in exopolysaccharide biosynthesis